MKKIKLLVMLFSLLLIPMVYQVQSAQKSVSPPPVDPVIVRQGDFARSLVEILELGKAYSETQAQEMLAELGIEPKNGWISDHPMTPGIIGELQNAIARASDYGYLAMNRSKAIDSFQTVVADYGLPIIPDDSRTNYSKTPPSFGSYSYTEPTVINNYYYHIGAPVVTYYPPPHGYYHLYSWVPYPFWWQSFWFSGYFVLNDFHRTCHVITLNRYGYKKHFRSHRRVIGVVSNRTKRYHHTRKGVVVYPSQRKFERKSYPGINTSGRQWLKPQKSGTKYTSPFFKYGREQRRVFGNNKVIRENNRSNEKFRNNPKHQIPKHQISNRFSTIPGQVNQRMERGINSSRTQIGNNPREIRKFNNSRGSIITPLNPAVNENRRGFDRSRFFDGNRVFERRNRSSFQRLD